MTMNELSDTILDAYREIDTDAASDGTMAGYLRKIHDVDVTREDVRTACDWLVEDGKLEIVGQKGSSKRYRLSDGH